MDLPTSLLPAVRLLSTLPNWVGFLSRVHLGFFRGNMFHGLLYPEQGFNFKVRMVKLAYKSAICIKIKLCEKEFTKATSEVHD
jgi:hypothetical protein